mmetsp:Transcript_11986/g.14899  ORF Transcript_11986/g.14899 Transcript_11986/m.14899 type:complete len:181 (+) Transcript_11986:264-806(+)
MESFLIKIPGETTDSKDGELTLNVALFDEVKNVAEIEAKINADTDSEVFAVDACWVPHVKILKIAALKTLGDKQRDCIKAGSLPRQFVYNLSPHRSISKTFEMMKSAPNTKRIIVGSFREGQTVADFQALMHTGKIKPLSMLESLCDKEFLCNKFEITDIELASNELWRSVARRISGREC